MTIAPYLARIGRGRDGARALDRAQAADLMGQVLDGEATDLEIGAFCAAMRIKGETPDEMAGFLDAVRARMQTVDDAGTVPVVLPSYNGARRLPVLTPLLALALAARGLPVLVHGMRTEATRVHAFEVFARLGIGGAAPPTLPTPTPTPTPPRAPKLAPGRVTCVATRTLLPALGDLLDVRRVVGLRNPAHSLVKLLNPCAGRALVVGCHTHPEYAVSMAGIFARIGADAMLLRGTEGEPVADARRMPALDAFIAGARIALESAQRGTLHTLPDLPAADPDATAHYVRAVLAGDAPMPEPIAAQVDHLVALHRQVVASAATGAVCA